MLEFKEIKPGDFQIRKENLICSIFVHVGNSGLTICCQEKSKEICGGFIIQDGEIYSCEHAKEFFAINFAELAKETLPDYVKKLFSGCFGIE